jgi:transcriptional regulator with XRE-family HTH domain
MNTHLLKLFGQKIRQLRTIKKLSQEQLAVMAELHRTYIGMIERGEKNITLLNIEKLAKALSIEIKDLFIFEKKDI